LPVTGKSYPNSDTCKAQILSENKHKSGIYMWKNLQNGKCYIGSAVNLSCRLSFYYYFSAMENFLKNSQSHICRALLKHGHSNFYLIILEYCDNLRFARRKMYWKRIFLSILFESWIQHLKKKAGWAPPEQISTH